MRTSRSSCKRRCVGFWDSPADLGSQVSRSLIKLIKNHPAVGWVRGDMVPDVPATEEILRLQRRIQSLEGQLAAARTEAPVGTERLAQGDDAIDIECTFKAYPPGQAFGATTYNHEVTLTWNDIFAAIAPLMIDEAPESALTAAISPLLAEIGREELKGEENLQGKTIRDWKISSDSFQTVKVQLRALELIKQSTRNHGVKDTKTYWTLTPYGDTVMTKLRAIVKGETVTSDSTSPEPTA